MFFGVPGRKRYRVADSAKMRFLSGEPLVRVWFGPPSDGSAALHYRLSKSAVSPLKPSDGFATLHR